MGPKGIQWQDVSNSVNSTPAFDRKIHDIAATWRISKQACSEASVSKGCTGDHFQPWQGSGHRFFAAAGELSPQKYRKRIPPNGQKLGFIESRQGYCLIIQVFKKNRSFSK